MNDRDFGLQADHYDSLSENLDAYDSEYESLESLTGFSGESGPDLFEDSAELAEALRDVLDDGYRDADTEDLEDALFDMLERMPPAEGFSFSNVLRTIGETGQKVLTDPSVRQVAATGLPLAGTALGGVFGGPLGASLGSQLGQAAGKAIPGGRKPAPAPTPPAGAAAKGAQAAPAPVPGGSAAATQVLQLTQNSDMLRSLLAAALGPYGQKSIQIGQQGPAVNLGAFMTMLSALAGKAAAEADEFLQGGEELSGYLLDSEGEYRVDPSVPEERALALYETLSAAEEDRLFGEDAPPPQPWADFFPFGQGAKLLVEYETRIRDFDIGKALVLEHKPNLLRVRIHIDQWERANIPETDAVLALEYKKDGPGNQALVTVNEQKFADKNVVIRSKGNTREILLSISILGQTVDKISLTRASAKKARLTFKSQGKNHTLILSRD